MVELLEREQQLAELGALRAAGGRLVFVGGEAGVGKTALMRTFAEESGEVLRGSCENLAAPTPLGPFLDVGLEPGEPRTIATSVLERGGVLVLEDVHWADGASLDVLRVLGRRVDGSNAFVVATYRDDEVMGDHPLRVVLGELASAPGVVRLTVPRLSLDAVRALASPARRRRRRRPPAHARERVLRHGGARRGRRRASRNGSRRRARARGAARRARRDG